jgi:hypothetical protein
MSDFFKKKPQASATPGQLPNAAFMKVVVVGGHRDISMLVRDLKAACDVKPEALGILSQREFRLPPVRQETEFVFMTGLDMGFSKPASYLDIYKKAVHHFGFQMCESADGAYYRLASTDQPVGQDIGVGMNPISGRLFSVYHSRANGLMLQGMTLHQFRPELIWMFRAAKPL